MCKGFAVALLVGFVSLLPAQGPDASKSIAQLIEQLGDKDFKVREAAAKAIETLGPDALPALRKAKDHPDLEVRRRINEWIPKFELEALAAPKRVNLDLKNETLEKIVAELARQTGYKLELADKGAPAQKRLSLRLVKATFWEALDRVCKEGGMELLPGHGSPDKIMLGFGGMASPYRAYQGAFRIRATGFHYSLSRQIQFARFPFNVAGKSQTENFQFNFDVAAEPRLTVLYLGDPSLTEALDDQKRSLLPKKQADDGRFAHARFMHSRAMRPAFFMGHELFASMNMLAPTKGARTVKVLRGTIPVYLEKGKTRTVLVENIAKAKGKKHKSPELTVEIDQFKQLAGNQYRVSFTFTRDKQEGKDGGGGGDGTFGLEDEKGNRYEAHGSSMSGDGRKTEAQISFGPRFNNAGPLGPPIRLVYTRSIPQEYNVSLEFKDLPLP